MISEKEYYIKIMSELKEYIFSTHKLPSISDISELVGISNDKCKEICEKLEGQKQIYTISGGGYGKPRIIIPYDMMESIFSTQPKPNWVSEDKYSFKEVEELQNESKKIDDEINKFQKFQLLLYGTHIPLEKSVAYALNYLKFKDVVHHLDNTDYADVTFKIDDLKYLLEVEGTTKKSDKQKVLQLDGWLRTEIVKGTPAKNLKGVLAVNHDRETPPEIRGAPLTPHAKEFMKRYNFLLITTPFLFELVKQVHNGKISKTEARESLLKGQDLGD